MAVRQYVLGAISNGSSTGTVVLSGVKSGSTIVIIGFSAGNTQTMSAPTDTAPNTYHSVWDLGPTGFTCYYAYNVSAGTVTVSSSVTGFCSCVGPQNFQLVAYELDSPAGGGDPLDKLSEAQCLTGTTHWTGTSVTTTYSSEVALSSCWGSVVNGTLSLGSSWGSGTLNLLGFGSNVAYGSASESLSSTASVMSDFNAGTIAVSGNNIFLGLATFKSDIAASGLVTIPGGSAHISLHVRG